jgi:uncharacterized protein (TIGR01244 family)
MFRQLDQRVWVSAQIMPGDVAVAAAQGVTLIINNRPEGEAPDQPEGAVIAEAAAAAGLDYVEIPISHAGFSQPQVAAMRKALAGATGPVLAYCRSGTRSTLLWALAQAAEGRDPGELASLAAHAGYDLAPIAAMLDMLAAGPRG